MKARIDDRRSRERMTRRHFALFRERGLAWQLVWAMFGFALAASLPVDKVCSGNDRPAAAKSALENQGQVDRSLYPKSYGILASEPLMFPVDHINWPAKIDGSRQLFVDDYLIAETDKNITREIHHPKKHPANPVLIGDKPWEAGKVTFQIVRRDAKTGRFRMWYTTQSEYRLPNGMRSRYPTLYAESKASRAGSYRPTTALPNPPNIRPVGTGPASCGHHALL